MSDKQYPSNLYLESVATNVDFAKQVPAEAVIVMAKELLGLRKALDGWKLVPVEPTRQMMSQGHFALGGTDRGKFRRIYQSMLAAAPEPE